MSFYKFSLTCCFPIWVSLFSLSYPVILAKISSTIIRTIGNGHLTLLLILGEIIPFFTIGIMQRKPYTDQVLVSGRRGWLGKKASGKASQGKELGGWAHPDQEVWVCPDTLVLKPVAEEVGRGTADVAGMAELPRQGSSLLLTIPMAETARQHPERPVPPQGTSHSPSLYGMGQTWGKRANRDALYCSREEIQKPAHGTLVLRWLGPLPPIGTRGSSPCSRKLTFVCSFRQ